MEGKKARLNKLNNLLTAEIQTIIIILPGNKRLIFYFIDMKSLMQLSFYQLSKLIKTGQSNLCPFKSEPVKNGLKKFQHQNEGKNALFNSGNSVNNRNLV